MALTIANVRKATPRAKDYKLFDERGLYLLVKKNGAKYWRFKYTINKKEKLLAFGVYPEVSLAEARERRDDARRLLRDGTDPAASKHQSNDWTFEKLVSEWLRVRGKKSESGDARLKAILEKDLIPALGQQTARDITPSMLLDTIRKIEARGAPETGRRANQYAGQIFRFGIASSHCDIDPSNAIKDALQPRRTKHFSAITNPEDFGKLLVAIDNYNATAVVSNALKLLPLIFCRPGELRHLEWDEVKKDRIEIPGNKTKTGIDLIIPLSKQAKSIIEDLEKIRCSNYVFFSLRRDGKPMSENALRVALLSMGFEATSHGFRASARTLLDEALEFPVHWIEHQLGHTVRDANGRAYNRTAHLKQRTGMMQAWADYLDDLKSKTGIKTP